MRVEQREVSTPVIPALERLRQEDCEFWSSVSYKVRLDTSLVHSHKRCGKVDSE